MYKVHNHYALFDASMKPPLVVKTCPGAQLLIFICSKVTWGRVLYFQPVWLVLKRFEFKVTDCISFRIKVWEENTSLQLYISRLKYPSIVKRKLKIKTLLSV